MKAAAWALEGLRVLARPGWRASCAASLFCSVLKTFAPRGKRILSNLALVYPESGDAWRKDLRRRLYEHLGWMVTEILALQRDPAQALDWVEEVRGADRVGEALDAGGGKSEGKGKGLLFLSGHYGNWELLAAWYAQYMKKRGMDGFYIVSQNMRDKDLSRLLARYRVNAGIRLLPKETPAPEIVRLLRSGKHIAALADISWPGGIVLPFMGHPCTHTIGPAVLAVLASVPIVPVALYRRGPFRHAAEFFPPLAVPEEKNRRVRIEALTREVSIALERMIAPRPELWFWLHNRWKQPLF
ncbi:MAG: lysophospholipid acyltransferase family protein [Synergistaceae bacterium]|jgi:KDO2-lipid IV(A) lauroyltransferase|nr:lysophospholipid acyltransferase family protein [Synergistaceae bacterium]